MKRFLLRLVLVIAPCAAALVYCEVRLTRAPPNEIEAKHQLFMARRPEIETLILGSSHTIRGADPAILGPRAFNLATAGQSLDSDCAIATRHLDALTALRCVILPVSYPSFENEQHMGRGRPRTYHYFHAWGIPHHDWRDNWEARNFSAFFLHRSDFPSTTLLWGSLPNAREDYDAWGRWLNPPPEPARSPEQLAAHLQSTTGFYLHRLHAMMAPTLVPANVARLRALAAQLHARGIPLVLITTPITRYFVAGCDRAVLRRWEAALAELKTLPGVVHFDHLQDERFTDADFSDTHHLNGDGAQKFSTLLRAEIAALRAAPPR